MLYIEHTNEKIEYINKYIAQGYGYNLPSPLMTSNMNLVSQGPVVRKPINANPGFKSNRGFHLAH